MRLPIAFVIVVRVVPMANIWVNIVQIINGATCLTFSPLDYLDVLYVVSRG